MKGIYKLLSVVSILISASVAAYEGPFQTVAAPKMRLSVGGSLQIFSMPAAANCHSNKLQVPRDTTDPKVLDMAFSMVLAAQMSGQKLNVWIEKYDTTTPQRCKLRFIEII